MDTRSCLPRAGVGPTMLVALLFVALAGCGSSASATPPNRQASLVATARAFDAAVLSGNFAKAYTYVDSGQADCALAGCFAPLANIAYGFGKGATLQVSAPEVSGDKGTVQETLLRGGAPIYQARGAFFVTGGWWYWHWTGTRWRLNQGSPSPSALGLLPPPSSPTPSIAAATLPSAPPSGAASTAATAANATPTTAASPTSSSRAAPGPTQHLAMQTPGPIPRGWCGVRLKDGDAVLILQDASLFCANYWVQNNHLAIGGNWEVAIQVPLDDSLVCAGRLGNAATPFEVWDTGDQHWGQLLCQAYQQQ